MSESYQRGPFVFEQTDSYQERQFQLFVASLRNLVIQTWGLLRMMYVNLLAVGVLPLTPSLQLVQSGLYHSLLRCFSLTIKSTSDARDLELTENFFFLMHHNQGVVVLG